MRAHGDETTAGDGALRRWLERSGIGRALERKLDDTGRLLSKRERRLVEAAADALFPPGDVMPLSGTEAGMVRYIEDYLGQSRPFERLLLHLLLRFTDLGPFAFGPAPKPFTSLDPVRRAEHLQSASQSRIYFRRIAFTSLRALMTMGYLAHPAVARRIGIVHDPDPFRMAEGKEPAR